MRRHKGMRFWKIMRGLARVMIKVEFLKKFLVVIVEWEGYY